MIHDLIIIGAGPAGMTAALYALRAGKTVLIFEAFAPGGQAALTNIIENYPGFDEGINGFELTSRMQKQIQKLNAEFKYDGVQSIVQNNKIFTVTASSGETHQSKTVVVATGSRPKKLGVTGEDKFFGRGIGTCAVCDGHFYKNRKVAVIGGGNSALEESLYLANIAEKVYIIHRFLLHPYFVYCMPKKCVNV